MKTKKIINRKCVITRKIYPKDNLLRVVRLPNGDIVFDEKQNKLGRGLQVIQPCCEGKTCPPLSTSLLIACTTLSSV